jgi:hypothetical protein
VAGLKAPLGDVLAGDDLEVALTVSPADVIMAGRGGEEQPLLDTQALIRQRITKRTTLSSCGFVSFIKDANVKGVTCCACTHDGRGLIGRENDFHIFRGMRKEASGDKGPLLNKGVAAGQFYEEDEHT